MLGRNFGGDLNVEVQLLEELKTKPRDTGILCALCDGWSSSAAFAKVRAALGNTQLPIPVAIKLVCTGAPPDKVAEALTWAASELEGDIWDCIPYWMPSVLRRLQADDAAFSQTHDLLLGGPSPGIKASFPRILSRARGLSDDLRDWCVTEYRRAENDFVGEVGMDLIAGQEQLVVHSLSELLSGPDA